MGVFHIFEILQIASNRATHHIYTITLLGIASEHITFGRKE